MATLRALFVCEGYSIDRISGNTSLFNIFESVSVGAIPKVCIVAFWKADAGDEQREFQALLKISEGENVLGEFPQNFRMTASSHRSMFNISGVPVRRAGQQLLFEMRLNGHLVGSYEVAIIAGDQMAGGIQ